MISELIELFAVIGDIYDAAMGRALWQQALAGICTYVGGASAALLCHHKTESSSQILHLANDDSGFSRFQAETCLPMNPVLPMVVSAGAGRVNSGTDVMPYRAFVETLYYRGWAAPQGFVDALIVMLERDAASRCLIDILIDTPPTGDLKSTSRPSRPS